MYKKNNSSFGQKPNNSGNKSPRSNKPSASSDATWCDQIDAAPPVLAGGVLAVNTTGPIFSGSFPAQLLTRYSYYRQQIPGVNEDDTTSLLRSFATISGIPERGIPLEGSEKSAVDKTLIVRSSPATLLRAARSAEELKRNGSGTHLQALCRSNDSFPGIWRNFGGINITAKQKGKMNKMKSNPPQAYMLARVCNPSQARDPSSENVLPAKPIGIWMRTAVKGPEAAAHHMQFELKARAFAAAKGWTVVEAYRLDGVSGTRVSCHAEAKRMKDDVKRGRIKGLITQKLSSLSRNTKELNQLLELFAHHGAGLISMSESLDTTDAAGNLFTTILAAMVGWEAEERRNRILAGLELKKNSARSRKKA